MSGESKILQAFLKGEKPKLTKQDLDNMAKKQAPKMVAANIQLAKAIGLTKADLIYFMQRALKHALGELDKHFT